MRCHWLWLAWCALAATCACALGEPREPRIVQPLSPIDHADLELSHIALVATVDGALHGIDRSTGQEVWVVGDEMLGRPLVFSSYGKHQRSFDEIVDDARATGDTDTLRALRGAGIYVVEPSAGGDLYMLRIRDNDARPHLERLPLSLPQLVDLSPFSFSSDDTRIYVAQKHTRLVELNVFTGKIGAVFDSTNMGACPYTSGARHHAVESPWIFIGRTDYTLTVYVRHAPEATQTVSYSVYAPNTADNEIGSLWLSGHQPADDRALLSAPDKSAVQCFDMRHIRRQSLPPLIWQHTFASMPLAVFDIVFAPQRSESHLLRPVLVPHTPGHLGGSGFTQSLRPSPYLGTAAGGSLFALGANRYPLVELAALAGSTDVRPALPAGPFAGIVGGYDVHFPDDSGGILQIDGAHTHYALPAPPAPQATTLDARLLAQFAGFALLVLIVVRGYVLIQRDRSPLVLSTETLSFDAPHEKGARQAEPQPAAEPEPAPEEVAPPSAAPPPPSPSPPPAEEPAAEDPAPEEEGTPRRRRRRRRGKRAGVAVSSRQAREEEESPSDVAPETRADTGPVGLELSNEVLGYGSSGTVVFRGKFQGRAVAVKRLLRDFVEMASKEVSLLQSADNHPNVIRYFYQEVTPNFLFIALEQCPASLADLIERPLEYSELAGLLEPRNALQQIAAGLQHLHSLSIVHRDIKPQNILVGQDPHGKLRMLLSDFGLSKRIDGITQSSFSQTVNQPGGTAGWRAPEILRGEAPIAAHGRLTRAVDIFSLGCVAYYLFTGGGHPFGTQYEREMNIIAGNVDLSRLAAFGENMFEVEMLVRSMISAQPHLRPTAAQVSRHPLFWTAAKRVAFLQDVSDRFETLEKDPPAQPLVLLERDARSIIGSDWKQRFDKGFMDDLCRFRRYDGTNVRDLLRAIRNKRHHYQDMALHLKRQLSPMPEGFACYFAERFPRLFLHVHGVIEQLPVLRSEPMFCTYFADE